MFDYPTVSALATHIAGVLPQSLASSKQAALHDDSSSRVANALARVLGILRGILGQDIAADQPLSAAGLDSLEVRDELTRSLFRPLTHHIYPMWKACLFSQLRA